MRDILKRGQEFTDFIKSQVPISARNLKVTTDIDLALKCYKEDPKDKSKLALKQKSIHSFFTKTAKNQFWNENPRHLRRTRSVECTKIV